MRKLFCWQVIFEKIEAQTAVRAVKKQFSSSLFFSKDQGIYLFNHKITEEKSIKVPVEEGEVEVRLQEVNFGLKETYRLFFEVIFGNESLFIKMEGGGYVIPYEKFQFFVPKIDFTLQMLPIFYFEILVNNNIFYLCIKSEILSIRNQIFNPGTTDPLSLPHSEGEFLMSRSNEGFALRDFAQVRNARDLLPDP